jgi:hypothetical protein
VELVAMENAVELDVEESAVEQAAAESATARILLVNTLQHSNTTQ